MAWFKSLGSLWPVIEEALKPLDEECHARCKAAAAKLEEDSYLQLNLVRPPPSPLHGAPFRPRLTSAFC